MEREIPDSTRRDDSSYPVQGRSSLSFFPVSSARNVSQLYDFVPQYVSSNMEPSSSRSEYRMMLSEVPCDSTNGLRLIDVDKIARLKHLNDNVYLILRGDEHGNPSSQAIRQENASVEIGVVVNSSSAGSRDSVHTQLSSGEHLPPQVQQQLAFLNNQIVDLQCQAIEIAHEFRMRYRREKALAGRVKLLEERMNAQVGLTSDRTSGCSEVQNSVSNQPAATGHPTTSPTVSKDQPSSIPILQKTVNRLNHTFESSSTGIQSRTHPGEKDHETVDDSRFLKRKHPSSPSGSSEGDSPAERPFWRDPSKPPEVPLNHCHACYETVNAEMSGKYCSSCESLVHRYMEAFTIRPVHSSLPYCRHPLGYPMRQCVGCIYKAFIHRENIREVSQSP